MEGGVARIKEAAIISTRAGDTTYYGIKVSQAEGDNTWKVEKRFKEFEELKLNLEYDGVDITSFPRKHLVRRCAYPPCF